LKTQSVEKFCKKSVQKVVESRTVILQWAWAPAPLLDFKLRKTNKKNKSFLTKLKNSHNFSFAKKLESFFAKKKLPISSCATVAFHAAKIKFKNSLQKSFAKTQVFCICKM